MQHRPYQLYKSQYLGLSSDLMKSMVVDASLSVSIQSYVWRKFNYIMLNQQNDIFSQAVLLFTLKHDNPTGRFWLCCLFSIINMFIILDYICTRVHLYSIATCTYGMIVNMCTCLLMLAICAVCHWPGIFYYWYTTEWILCNYRWISSLFVFL